MVAGVFEEVRGIERFHLAPILLLHETQSWLHKNSAELTNVSQARLGTQIQLILCYGIYILY